MHRREGQALVLAALMVLILSIAVLATINLGHNITERVRLQNTADSAAYSMAAMEARAYNFYAFANRTQVSHYVAAMVWQSMLSMVYFLEAFVTDVLGVLLTIDVCSPTGRKGEWALICTGLEAILPALVGVFQTIDRIKSLVQGVVSAIQQTLKNLNPDAWIGKVVIPGHRILNQSLGALSQVTLAATMANVTNMSEDVIAENDPNLDTRLTRIVPGVMSACLMERAHMKEAGVSMMTPEKTARVSGFLDLLGVGDQVNEDDNKVGRAKRSMAKISNATRFACDNLSGGRSYCGRGWVTDRRPQNLIDLPPELGLLGGLMASLDWKWGQTKMLSYKYSVNPIDDRNYIRDWKSDLPGQPWSDLGQGDTIGSDDIYQIKIGPPDLNIAGLSLVKNPLSCKDTDDPMTCWGDPRKGLNYDNSSKLMFKNTVKPSIWAMNKDEVDGGLHWRLVTLNSGISGVKRSDLPNKEAGGGTIFGSATPNRYRGVGLNIYEKEVIFIILKVMVYVANVRRIADGNHPWDGLAHFPHFEPGQYSGACGGLADPKKAADRADEFNQPSTWVVLHKTPEQLRNPNNDTTGAGNNKPALLNDTGAFTLQFTKPTKLTIDNSRKEFLQSSGLHVVSRGQTYYHRPGNWAEQPNFFNPYWKPRLASVWQGRNSLPIIKDLENVLPADLKKLPPKILTH